MTTAKNGYGSVLILMVILMLISLAFSQCPTDNYSPCYCVAPSFHWDDVDYRVTCNASSVYEIRKSQFVISPVNLGLPIKEFLLILRDQDRYIPANLLGNRNVTSLTISCHLQNTMSNYLNLNPDAFRASKLSLINFNIKSCNLMNLDWSFLTGFENLDTLGILYSSNFHFTFYTLPPLKTLSSFYIESMAITAYTPGMMKYPKLVNGLSDVYFSWDQDPFFSPSFIEGFMTWLTKSSAHTLISLEMAGDILSNLTDKLGSFHNLTSLKVNNNAAPMTIGNSDLAFSQELSVINAGFSNIYSIANGAFGGNFSDTVVNLYGNRITTFSAGVFKSMLIDMVKSTGYLEIYGNPIDCDTNPCSMAWLIRDNPQLLSAVYSGQCSNGNYFYQLNATAYKKCPKTSSRSIILRETME